ncbi:C2 domain-containing protein [Aureococcus anophagefferens]|nr:C2 domain-containing protein [Aureococcus anophagefferens]
MAALNGAEWDAVSPRVDAVLVLYDHDGKTPKRRQFKTLDEGVVAFDRLQQFHAALRVKHRAPPNAEVMVLFARASRRSDVWYAARSSGEGVAAVALENWVGLRRLAKFEAGSSRVVAVVGGCLLRALLWVFVQRKPATAATPRPWPPWVVRLLSLGLEFFWPTIRATINNSVNVLVLPIANAAIARMENRAIDKLTKLELDIGSEAPTPRPSAASRR